MTSPSIDFVMSSDPVIVVADWANIGRRSSYAVNDVKCHESADVSTEMSPAHCEAMRCLHMFGSCRICRPCMLLDAQVKTGLC